MLEHISKENLKNLQKTKSSLDKDFFTKKEFEVLKLICQQKSTVEIGDLLFISPRTVEGHRNNLFIKTDTKNLAGLVIFALQNEFISLDDTIDL